MRTTIIEEKKIEKIVERVAGQIFEKMLNKKIFEIKTMQDDITIEDRLWEEASKKYFLKFYADSDIIYDKL